MSSLYPSPLWRPTQVRSTVLGVICFCIALFALGETIQAAAPRPLNSEARPKIPSNAFSPLHDPALHAWIMEDWQRLVAVASEWTLAEPSNAAAWRYLGDAYFGIRAMEKAEHAYSMILRIDASAEAWAALGETHLLQGIAYQLESAHESATSEFAKALVCMQSALAMDPDYAGVLGGMGVTLYYQQETELARAALESHLAHYSKDARSWHYLGMAHADLAADELAISAFRASIKLTSNPLSQLRNWLLLRESATKIGHDELLREANENLYSIAGIIRDRQAASKIAGVQ